MRLTFLSPPGFALSLALVGLCTSSVCAQDTPAQSAAAPVPSEAQVQVIVLQDEATRVQELRVRGMTHSITVTPTSGQANWRGYQITPKDSNRDATGQGRSSWRVMGF